MTQSCVSPETPFRATGLLDGLKVHAERVACVLVALAGHSHKVMTMTAYEH